MYSFIDMYECPQPTLNSSRNSKFIKSPCISHSNNLSDKNIKNIRMSHQYTSEYNENFNESLDYIEDLYQLNSICNNYSKTQLIYILKHIVKYKCMVLNQAKINEKLEKVINQLVSKLKEMCNSMKYLLTDNKNLKNKMNQLYDRNTQLNKEVEEHSDNNLNYDKRQCELLVELNNILDSFKI